MVEQLNLRVVTKISHPMAQLHPCVQSQEKSTLSKSVVNVGLAVRYNPIRNRKQKKSVFRAADTRQQQRPAEALPVSARDHGERP